MAFDVLSLDGEPTGGLPYCERRELLAATREQGLEGVVAKRIDSPYTPGERSAAWIKHKHLRTERLTVVGHARLRRGARLLVASGAAGEPRYCRVCPGRAEAQVRIERRAWLRQRSSGRTVPA